jgi:hypothetical protein
LTLPAVPYSGRNRLATVHALEGDRAAGSHLCHREVAPPIASPCRRTPHRANACECDPAPWLSLSDYWVKTDGDLTKVKPIIRAAMDRRMK